MISQELFIEIAMLYVVLSVLLHTILIGNETYNSKNISIIGKYLLNILLFPGVIIVFMIIALRAIVYIPGRKDLVGYLRLVFISNH